MSVEIKVPSLGESVTEATIARWYKKQGDAVKMDELLLELETEKVTLEVNASAAGVLEKITRQQGETVAVGELLGSIAAGAAQGTSAAPAPSAPVQAATAPATPLKKIDPVSAMPPSVTKIVAENNLNPAAISGTGKDGRITKGDALAAIEISPKTSVSTATERTAGKQVERVRMSRLRKTIAQRLKDSQNTAAILTTFNEIDMTNVISLRQKYRDEFEKKHGIKLGFMSFFVKAAIEALKVIPAVNAEIDGDDLIYKNYYDIGVAVGTEQGLVVPVVRGADKLSFAGVETEIANLGKKAREGKLSMADLSGGTFTISNGGVYGSLLSTPIINPPQSGILGLHKTQERPMAINGKVEIRQMMYVALSYDHRIIDGKEAVTFLVKVKEAMENPERLLLNL
jgi:2-oxoglutarate dehydrogenase E2 component (dihydrolipoamide succinyltransferase)